MAREMIVDEKVKVRARKVREYAEQHRMNIADLLGRSPVNEFPAPGDIPEHIMLIDVGYRVVYSQEVYGNGKIIARMSVSVDRPGRLPNPYVVEEIMKLFEFKHDLAHCAKAIEHIDEGHDAILLMEVISETNGNA